ncbi:beta strand repeat-containing protein [Pseudoduganella umbonata]|uniref:Ca2+-binding RTX toxin-like protein n=1 Tax=Pseudoduganella umbonata TaxID=864828 RepID=A0A4P8HSX2_9BURK|nr:calcium-binding protein [Pseudoduganella umbonata]MBB3222855.1 Ca2+-binding RTX toxin-like protein [Pseudoduganella umbonata]QCP12987.1 calcium-binding protein [Pseudoduganella umbonata]
MAKLNVAKLNVAKLNMAKLDDMAAGLENVDSYAIRWGGAAAAASHETGGVLYGIDAPGAVLRIAGTVRDDVLGGTNGSDTLDGAAGNDTMQGGLGDDEYHADSTGDVVQEVTGGGIDTVHCTASRFTLSANVEALQYAGAGSFTGIGNALANSLVSGNGNDRLEGGSGDDRLSAGAGHDTMIGGAGNDGVTAASGNDMFDGGTGIDTVYAMAARDSYAIRRAGTDGLVFTAKNAGGGSGQTLTVHNVEYFGMAGSFYSLAEFLAALPPDGSDTIQGTAGSDWLDGFDGADTLAGGAGNDTYVVRNAGTVVVELDGGGIDTAQVAYAGKAWQLAGFVENGSAVEGKLGVSIDGNALANTLTGNAGANVLAGGAGNDTLDGGKGSDVLAGGSGNDLYYVDATGDTVTEQAGEGTDSIVTTQARITLADHVENVAYAGTSAFTATGNSLDNVIAGGSGNNRIDGGTGTDTFVVSGAFADYTRDRPNANDVLLVKGEQRITLKNIEQVQFSDGLRTMSEIFFNKASLADDTLAGTDGNDTMDGLAGADRMRGLKGNDTYRVDNAGDTTVELAGEGFDTVDIAIKAKVTYTLGAYVEDATITSTSAVNVTGNAANNKLTGNGAANVLAGGDGNDILVGGKGGDTLDGGAGNDYYSVDAAGDMVVEAANGGHDIVETTATKHALSANVEALRYTGKSAFTGIGNALDNVIAGGAANDKLTGGAGRDTFVIGTGKDTIADFATGIDKLMIDRAVGNGNAAIDGAIVVGAPGGFSADAELVIFTQNATSLTVTTAAKTIGSAATAYANGDTALFALHSGSTTALYLFSSSGNDALVGAAELTQIATLTGVASAAVGDFGVTGSPG